MEKFETPRERTIRVRAHKDAKDYIILMERVSPESLQFQPNGEININIVKGSIILNNAQQSLGLTLEETLVYTLRLADAVKINLAKKI